MSAIFPRHMHIMVTINFLSSETHIYSCWFVHLYNFLYHLQNQQYNEFSLSSRSPVAPSCQGFDFRDLRMFTLLMFEAQPITSKQLPNFLMIIIKTSDKLFWTFLMWIFYMKQQHDNVLHVQRKRKDRLYPQTISSTSNISSYVFLAIQGCNNNTFSDLLRLASRLVLANKKTRSKPSRLDTTTGFFYYNGPKI